MGSPLTPFIFICLTALAGGIFGHFLIRRGRRRAVLMLVLGHLLGAAALYLGAHQAQAQAAAMSYVMFLFLLVLPSLVGVILGAALGWWRGPAPKID